jgi:hypothetical protein
MHNSMMAYGSMTVLCPCFLKRRSQCHKIFCSLTEGFFKFLNCQLVCSNMAERVKIVFWDKHSSLSRCIFSEVEKSFIKLTLGANIIKLVIIYRGVLTLEISRDKLVQHCFIALCFHPCRSNGKCMFSNIVVTATIKLFYNTE